MLILRMAWRNLWRNSTRTLITATAIALAYALYLMANGVQDWTFAEMRTAAAKAAGGHVLVQADGYQDTMLNDQLVSDGAATLERVRAVEGVDAAAPRVIIGGLVSTSASSNPVMLRGIEPASEAKIHDMSEYLVEGTWFEGDADDPIVLGKSLAEELEAQIGDRIILTASDADDELNRALFHLTGILSTGSALADKTLAFTRVDVAQQALHAPDRYTQIGVIGPPPREELATRVRAAVTAEDVDVMPWDVAMPDLIGFIEMKKGGGAFFGGLLFLVVLFAITNTFLMIVMERVREFGLLQAIGLGPRRAAMVLLTETALLALVAMAIGLGLALIAHTMIATYGIDFSQLYGNNLDVAGVSLADTTIYSKIDPLRWGNTSIAVFFMVLLAAIYPAWKASRLRPTEAMRFYE